MRVPGLLWLLTDIKSTEPVGILRYFLADDGTVIGKRILGRGFGMAIRLSPDEEVEQGLHIAANSEVGLRAMMDGLRPVWAVTNASAATAFPPLASLEVTGHRRAKGTAALTITPERQYIILYRLNEGCP